MVGELVGLKAQQQYVTGLAVWMKFVGPHCEDMVEHMPWMSAFSAWERTSARWPPCAAHVAAEVLHVWSVDTERKHRPVGAW